MCSNDDFWKALYCNVLLLRMIMIQKGAEIEILVFVLLQYLLLYEG